MFRPSADSWYHFLLFHPCPEFSPKQGTDFSPAPDRGLVVKRCRLEGWGVATNKEEKIEMTRKIRSFAGLAMLLTALAASGQIAHQARVTVPFSFVAGGTSSPAGDYKVSVDEDRKMVTLLSDGSKPVMLFTISAWAAPDGRSYLRFHHYGEHWFLEKIAINGVAQEVPIDKRVKQVFTASNQGTGGPVSSDVAVH